MEKVDRLKRILNILAYLLIGVISSVALFYIIKFVAKLEITLILMLLYMGVWR
nr:MAG TPA: hypothetical protein [Caudoviricetes sp.]